MSSVKSLRQEHYIDGVTKITDPFYKCICKCCTKAFWGVTKYVSCPFCGGEDVFQTLKQEEFDEMLKHLKGKV